MSTTIPKVILECQITRPAQHAALCTLGRLPGVTGTLTYNTEWFSLTALTYRLNLTINAESEERAWERWRAVVAHLGWPEGTQPDYHNIRTLYRHTLDLLWDNPVLYHPELALPTNYPAFFRGMACPPDPEREVAYARAVDLLQSILTVAEQEEWDTCRQVTIPSQHYPERMYVVPRRGTIRRYDRGAYICSYCLQVEDDAIPWLDVTVARILLLKSDEAAFLGVANRMH